MTSEHYWKELYRLKVHVTFLEMLLARNETIDRNIKIFLALTSSASIGAWAVVKDHALIWGAIIAASQVLNVARQYLPFKERVRTLSGLKLEFEELLLQVESRWLEVAAGELTNTEIRRALNELRARRQKALRKHFPDKAIPKDAGLFAEAEKEAELYISNFYGAKEDE